MRHPRNWPFWQIPRRLLVAVLTVEVTAVLLVARLALDGFPGPAAIWRAAAISACATPSPTMAAARQIASGPGKPSSASRATSRTAVTSTVNTATSRRRGICRKGQFRG